MGSCYPTQLARLPLISVLQLSLSCVDTTPLHHRARPLHRLFFAALPPQSLRESIYQIAPELTADQGVRGRMLDFPRLHVSLLSLGDFATFPFHIAPLRAESFGLAIELIHRSVRSHIYIQRKIPHLRYRAAK